MKVQKEKKEKKERGDVDEEGDTKMEEISASASENKKRKVKGTEIAKIKSKRSVDTSSDEPTLKKKKKVAASEEKDLFFLKPEDKPVLKKKAKVVVSKETAPNKEAAKVVATPAPAPAPVPTATLPQKPKSKAETGVVGVVDKTKKLLKAGKKTTDVVAALESESKKQEVNSSGTGLDVGGWD